MPLVEAFYKQVPVLAYAATAVPSTMDGAGVLFDDTDPVARGGADGRDPFGRGAAGSHRRRTACRRGPPARAQDFAGTLLGFVDQILSRPRAPQPAVAFDFWHQFDAAQELEELRLYRPSIYKALPDA